MLQEATRRRVCGFSLIQAEDKRLSSHEKTTKATRRKIDLSRGTDVTSVKEEDKGKRRGAENKPWKDKVRKWIEQTGGWAFLMSLMR